MAVIRLTLLALLLANAALADDRRAAVNYMLHCQGCHLPEAEGFEGKVPPMKDFAGYFLHTQDGREFLIRVPGVAHAALSDEEIAELMNWLLLSYSAEQLPPGFSPFTASEVRALRASPEKNPELARRAVLAGIAAENPGLSLQPDEP